MPVELDELTRRERQLEVERAALKRETDAGTKQRLQRLEEDLERIRTDKAKLDEHWKKEKQAVQKIRDLKSMSDALKQLVEHCRGDHRPNCPILEALAVPAGPGKRAVTRKGSSEACH